MGTEDPVMAADPPEVQAERRRILTACRAECDRNPDCGDDDLCARCRGELILEAAVNSRLAFRVLSQDHAPRITRLERRALFLAGGIAALAALIVPIAAAILGAR